MSDTPETDAETHDVGDTKECLMVFAEFARKLERERDVAYAALHSIREGYGGQKVDEECKCDDCNFLRPIDAIIKNKVL